MASVSIPWTTGSGNITLSYTNGEGNSTVYISSTESDITEDREQTIRMQTTSGSPVCTAVITIRQQAMDGHILILASTVFVNESNTAEFVSENSNTFVTEPSEDGAILLENGENIIVK